MKLGNQGYSFFFNPERIKIYHFSGSKAFPHFIQSITQNLTQGTGPVWASLCLMRSLQAAVRMMCWAIQSQQCDADRGDTGKGESQNHQSGSTGIYQGEAGTH